MPGAGSAYEVAWAAETSYLGGTGTGPTYYAVGTNPTVETAELSNNLLKVVAPGDPEAQRYLAQNLEGQLSVSFVMTNDEYHRLIFSDGNTGFTSGTFPSAEWYLGVDHFGSTTERQIQGWVPATASIQYQQGQPVRVTLTGPYGDEQKNTSISPGTIVDAGDEVPHHGANLSVDGTTITKLQSAQLNISQIARLIRGTDRHPVEAVQGAVETSLDHTAVYESSDRLELAYGSSGSTTPQDQVGGVSGSLAFSANGSTIADYTLTGATPESVAWDDLVNPDEDLTQPVTYQVESVSGSDPDA